VSEELAERLRPFATELERLATIPGVGRRTAEVLVAEIGTDMGRFPTRAHLASWAGMCPGNDESAVKRRSGKTRKGSPWLRSTLIEAARAAGRSNGTYLAAQYYRLAARRGTKRAAVAVGHTILGVVYRLLSEGDVYPTSRTAISTNAIATRSNGVSSRAWRDSATQSRSIWLPEGGKVFSQHVTWRPRHHRG
jgi:hypothetical protein